MLRTGVTRYKRVVALALSIVLTLATASPVGATHDALDQQWKFSEYMVGSCGRSGNSGIKRGNSVRLVQMILNSALLLPVSGIDGVWGPKTDAALQKWQSRHRLTPDGCVGFDTFKKMQEGGDRICPPRIGECYVRPHMKDLGNGVWRYSEAWSDPTHYKYFYTDYVCWYIKVGNQWRAVVRSGNVCWDH